MKSRSSNVIMILFPMRVVAAVPAGHGDIGFRQRRHVDLGLETVQDRANAKRLPANHGLVRSTARIALAADLHHQIDAAAELGLIAKVEFAAAVATLPEPITQLLGQ